MTRGGGRVAAGAGVALLLAAPVGLVGALRGRPVLSAVGGVGTWLAADRLLRWVAPRLPERAGAVPAALQAGLTVEQALVLVLVLRSGKVSRTAEDTAVVTAVLLAAARGAWLGLQLAQAELRRERILVRNLDVPGAQLPRQSRLLTGPGLPAPAWPGLGLSLVAAAAVLTGSSGVLLGGCALALVPTAALTAAQLPVLAALRRAPRGRAHRDLVHGALLRHAPLVVLYFGGGPGSVYAATAWLRTLERIRQPAFVLLRDPAALDRLGETVLPVVCVPRIDDVFPFSQPTPMVSLFAVNETENLRLLRNPRLRSAFVGHGDSDKAGSTSPLSRAYDEIWVAGPAGRRRYRAADVGVRDDAVREVGRPQAADVQPARPSPGGTPYTVLYAPTWEGLELDSHTSSLQVAGRQVVAELLALPDVRVLYRPHPRTGSRVAAAAAADRDIRSALRAAGEPHRVLAGDGVDLGACFDDADALVTDVSSVIPDFLASGKPYFVVDVRGLPDADFRREVPTAGAAYVVGPAAKGLRTGLADARDGDSLRERRLLLRGDLLGPPVEDAYAVVSDAVDALAALRRGPVSGR